MTTAGKLWLGFGLLLMLLVGTGLYVAHRLATIERSLLTIMAVQEPATAATYELAVNVIATRSAVLHYVESGDTAQRTRIVSLGTEFSRYKARFDLVARSATSRELARRIDVAYAQFHRLGDSLMTLSDRQRARNGSFSRRWEEIGTLLGGPFRARLDGKGRDAQRRLADVALFEADVAGVTGALGQYLQEHEGRQRARVTYHEGRFQETLRDWRDLKLSDEERAQTDALTSGFATLIAEARDIMAWDDETRDVWNRFVRSGSMVERLVDEGIRSLARTDLLEAQQSARRAIRTSLIAVLLLLVAGILIGSGTAIPTARSIVRADQALRERMRELGEADRRKDEFLGVLGHELRNPLAPLSNALNALAARGAEVPEDVRRTHAMMMRQVGSMSRLVDDLLDVSRINEGKITLRPETVDLGRIAAETSEDLRPQLELRRHLLELVRPRRPVWVKADPTRLAQVASNLLNNAIKYTPEGGRIVLEVTNSEEEALLRVSDNGIGIAPEMLPLVFEPFSQGDHSPDRAQGGLGIGLTLVNRLVEMHGGSTRAASPGPGRGSTFTVSLPLAPPPAAAPAPAATAAPARSRRILVVDDNQDSAQTMAALLRLWGHEVEVANDGPAALAAAASHPPHLALLDIGLPGMDGYEVARRLRGAAASPGMTLIALTGLGREEDRRKAVEAGFDRHLTKPVSPETLRGIVASVD